MFQAMVILSAALKAFFGIAVSGKNVFSALGFFFFFFCCSTSSGLWEKKASTIQWSSELDTGLSTIVVPTIKQALSEENSLVLSVTRRSITDRNTAWCQNSATRRPTVQILMVWSSVKRANVSMSSPFTQHHTLEAFYMWDNFHDLKE